jgi:NAD(P)-dependent dehydrogenase (short-subunit alcohol dehydrogenase family)
MSINKIAIITGASRGIGRAIARKLYEAGGSVALCARSAIVDFPQERSLAVTMDVRDQKSVDAGIRRIVDRFGKIDIVVNNAALPRSHPSTPPIPHHGSTSSKLMLLGRITSRALQLRIFRTAVASS